MIIKVVAITVCCIIATGYILAVTACIKMRHEEQLLDRKLNISKMAALNGAAKKIHIKEHMFDN